MNQFSSNLKKAYTLFYNKGMWKPIDGGSKSGIGSNNEYSGSYSKNLVRIIKEYKIKKIFDCSCGDWFWMQHIQDNFKYYIGNDVCENIIEENKNKYESKNIKFICNDMLSQMKLQNDLEYDLVICRHTLEHLPIEYNINSISEMKRISKYAIITSANLSYSTNQNSEIVFGENFSPPYNSINLDLEPYNQVLPEPIEKFWDSVEENKSSIGTFGYLYKFN